MPFLLSDYHYVIIISKMVLHIMIYYSYNVLCTAVHNTFNTSRPPVPKGKKQCLIL